MSEEFASEKIIGYILIFVGLVIISFSAFSVYSVFTGKASPFELFSLPGVSVDLTEAIKGSLPQDQFQLVVNQSPKVKSEIIAAEVLNTPLNFVAHLLLMGFIANIGFKIGSLGTQFVRAIKLNLRIKEEGQIPKAE